MPNTLKIKRGTNATIPQGQLAEPLFTTDTYDLYIGKGAGGNQRIQNYIASGTSSQFLKGDGSLDSTTYQATSEKGQNNGYASLDAGGKIPAAQLPSSVIEYKGTWNASTNTPTLADGTGDAGDVYIVSVGGTQNLGSGSITFDAGDWVMYNGSIWQKSTGSNAVASVNGQTGIVSIGVNDLDDATITSVSNGQLLQYSTGTNKWVNWTPNYVPYTGATANVDLGFNNFDANQIYGFQIVTKLNGTGSSPLILKTGTSGYSYGNDAISLISSPSSANTLTIISDVSSVSKIAEFGLGSLTATRTYTLPDATGTLALTSNIPANIITGTGTTNTLPKFTGATTLGNSNVTDSGTLITLGSNSYVNGALGIGTTSLTDSTLKITRNITGASGFYAVDVSASVQSDVVTSYTFRSQPSTQAAAFSTDLIGFFATQGTTGAGSTITSHTGVFINNLNAGSVYGVRVLSSNTGTSTAQAFRGDLAAGTNVWNLYMNGTANNYMAGSLGIGQTSLDAHNLRVTKAITGGTVSYGIRVDGAVQSGVTSSALLFSTSASTQATTFTTNALFHFSARQATFGAGSTVTSQIGFYAENSLIGATNNYGFQGEIASGANRWNLYMNGTAANYLAGSLNIGTTSVLSDYPLNVQGTVNGNLLMRFANTSSGTSARLGLILNTDFGTLGSLDAYGTAYNIGSTDDIANGVRLFASGAGGLSLRASNASGTIRFYNGSTESARFGTNGALGIGTTSLTGYSLRANKALTGNTDVYGIANTCQANSDATSTARSFYSEISTQAASYTLSGLYHYWANQGSIGAGSTVTSQFGFFVHSSLVGATNNFGFYGNIPSGTNRWNLYMNGTADNHLGGKLTIGSATTSSNSIIYISRPITGSTSANGIIQELNVSSDVTTQAFANRTILGTAAASFNLSILSHYIAGQGTIGAGSTITTQIGYWAQSNMIGATTNIGFYGDIAAGTNRWNLYMNGTANNYMAGALGIGTTSLTGFNLRVTKNITGATTSYGIMSDGVIQSDVTSAVHGIRSTLGTAAASFTLSNLYNFSVLQSSFGVGSSVTNQYGFFVENTMIGATNNYGFYGNIASGANRWNLYMAGTAANYLAGKLLIGSTTDSGEQLQVTGTAKVTGAATFSENVTISKNQNALTRLIISNTTAGTGSYIETSFTSDSSAGSGAIGKFSSTTTAYKFVTASNTYLYNGGTAGDIAILNDFASGSIKLAAGGSSSAHLTISSTGAATFSSSVTASGNFITSNSNVVLGVGNTSNNESVVFSYNSNASSRSWRILKDWTAFGDFQIQQSTTQTGSSYDPKFVINPSGSVGIGTPSPSASDWNASATLLHIYQNSTNGSILKLESSNAAGVVAVGNNQMQIATTTDDPMIFYTNSAERMRITSGGAITTGGLTDGYLTATNRGNITIYGSTDSILALRSGASGAGYFYHTGTHLEIYNTNSGYIKFATENAEVLRLTKEAWLYIQNRTAAPAANPVTGGYLYCESGALKYRGSSGTVTTIANA